MKWSLVVVVFFTQGIRLVHPKQFSKYQPQDIAKDCQEVTLHSTEYTIQNGSVLTIYNQNLSCNMAVKLSEKTATLCFPFTKHFQSCKFWFLCRKEYTWINGSAILWDKVHKVQYLPGEYKFCSKQVRVCVPQELFPTFPALQQADHYLTLVGWILSAIALAIAFIIYSIISHGTIADIVPILCHMASLFLAYVFLIIHQLVGRSDNICICYVVAIGKQFSVLAAVCWLNVIAFDLWWRFRSVKLFHPTPSRTSASGLILKSVHGWGVPLVVVVTSIFCDVFKAFLRPRYLKICWVNGWLAEFTFFYGPVSIAMTGNVILFFLTLNSLRQVRRYIIFSKNSMQRQILCLSAKLMVVMGITWIFDVITWATGLRPEYAIFFNVLNAFQGVCLFVVYMCRKHVRMELKTTIVTFLTDNCCFCIAKRVAVTPFKAQNHRIGKDATSSSAV